MSQLFITECHRGQYLVIAQFPDETRPHVITEGPFDSFHEAEEYADSEVGGAYRVVRVKA